MTSEACPVCGEEVDSSELDPHGHFAADDVPTTFRGDPSAAEDDLRRVSDAHRRAEEALAKAQADLEALEEESVGDSADAEEKLAQRMEDADQQVIARQEEVAEAEDDLQRTHDHWQRQGYLP